jgi:hypothetical protein
MDRGSDPVPELLGAPAFAGEERTASAGIEAEARALVAAGARQGLGLWLLGGIAVLLHVPTGTPPLFQRACRDIDFVIERGAQDAVESLLRDHRYEPDSAFNLVNGHRRLLFHSREHERQIDVFVERFAMCHAIPLGGRLAPGTATIPLAELLLTKLQIVELNAKDQSDVLNLLFHNELTEHSDEGIDAARVARLCAQDWGLWRTSHLNLERTERALATAVGLAPEQTRLMSDRLRELRARIEREPKTRAWRLRNRIGDRIQWYEEPEEV